jgi:hypothetical protein
MGAAHVRHKSQTLSVPPSFERDAPHGKLPGTVPFSREECHRGADLSLKGTVPS